MEHSYCLATSMHRSISFLEGFITSCTDRGSTTVLISVNTIMTFSSHHSSPCFANSLSKSSKSAEFEAKSFLPSLIPRIISLVLLSYSLSVFCVVLKWIDIVNAILLFPFLSFYECDITCWSICPPNKRCNTTSYGPLSFSLDFIHHSGCIAKTNPPLTRITASS